MDIKIVGNLLSKSFYTSKFILFNLVKHRPDLVDKYLVRGVLDVEWTRCLWKLNQILGGMRRQNTVAIFINKMYVGTDVEFQKYLTTEYNFTINLWILDYKKLMCDAIQNYYSNDKLFEEQVPETCKFFKELCSDKTDGYSNSMVHRIDTSNGFIQAGRLSNRMAYIEKENYKVNHDRRGVLSLAGKYDFFNGPEFIISLQPNPWMNNKYVAFGQAVEGERTLRFIEKLFDSGALTDVEGGGGGGGPARVYVTSCDVLSVERVDTLATVTGQRGLEDYLMSLVRGTVRKAMYVNVYGKPERLRSPPLAAVDRLYVKSIVGIIMRDVMRKIDASRRQSTVTPRRSASSCSTSTTWSTCSTTWSVSSVRSNWDSAAGTVRDLCLPTMLRPRSIANSVEGSIDRDEIRIPSRKTDRTAMVKSKGFSENAGRSRSTETTYGVCLSENHKDYWNFKKIYESVAK